MKSPRRFAIGLLMMLVCASPLAASDNPVVLGRARFTVITPECLRLEDSARGEFTDEPSLVAIDRTARFNGFSVTVTADSVVLDTGRMALTYRADGNGFSRDNLEVRIRSGASWASWTPGTPEAGNLGGTLSTLDGLAGPARPGDGLLALCGWHLLDDSRRPVLCGGWVEPRPRDRGTDWYLFGYARDFRAALRALTAVGGPVPLPRKVQLGAWYSRYWPYSSADFRAIAEEFDAHDYPLDVMVLDMNWHKAGWTGWSWNRSLLPDAEELLGWLHGRGLAVTLNAHPASGVGRQEDRYEDYMRLIGADPAAGATPFDPSNRLQMEALSTTVLAPLDRAGVDFWWVDWQQGAYTRGNPELGNLWWLNHLFTQWSTGNGRRGAVLSRWGGWGDHRHPIHFSGDTDTGWPMLRFMIPFTATSGNVGCFFWSHDIGGHMGPRNEESFVRWTQFGAVSAALRLHSGHLADQDRRPWMWSPDAERAMHAAFALRARLFPYIYSAAWQAHDESVPLLRPPYLDYARFEEAFRNPQEYLLGDAFLAAPVTAPGAGPGRVATQTVWFPPGRWVHWFSGEVVEGPAEWLVPSTLDEFPLYVRAGVPVPLQPPTRRMATAALTTLTVRCQAAADGTRESTTLYEDDGESAAYLDGRYALTPLTYERTGDNHRIQVGPAAGTYAGQPAARSIEVELGGVTAPVVADADGRPLDVVLDAATGLARVILPPRPVCDPVTINIRASEEDRGIRSDAAVRRRLGALLGRVLEGSPKASLVQALGVKRADQEALLGAVGIGWREKPESPSGYGGRTSLHLYDGAGWLDGGGVRLRVTDRAGGAPELIDDAVHEFAPGRPARLDAEWPPLADPAALGRPVVRRITLSGAIEGRKVAAEFEGGRRGSYLSRWVALGPFAFNPDSPLKDQRALSSAAHIDFGAPLSNADGIAVRWQPVASDADHVISLKGLSPDADRYAYAATWITSRHDQPVTFSVTSDDGIEMWLNGSQIDLHDAMRTIRASPDIISARLRRGRNLLLVKVSQGVGEWAFRVEVEADEALREAVPAPEPPRDVRPAKRGNRPPSKKLRHNGRGDKRSGTVAQ